VLKVPLNTNQSLMQILPTQCRSFRRSGVYAIRPITRTVAVSSRTCSSTCAATAERRRRRPPTATCGWRWDETRHMTDMLSVSTTTRRARSGLHLVRTGYGTICACAW